LAGGTPLFGFICTNNTFPLWQADHYYSPTYASADLKNTLVDFSEIKGSSPKTEPTSQG
jgi:hypothetical protein